MNLGCMNSLRHFLSAESICILAHVGMTDQVFSERGLTRFVSKSWELTAQMKTRPIVKEGFCYHLRNVVDEKQEEFAAPM